MEIKSKRFNKHEITHALKIYNHFIINSLANFEENPLSTKEFDEIIKNIKKNNLPFLIAQKMKMKSLELHLLINLEVKVDIGLHLNIPFMLIHIS